MPCPFFMPLRILSPGPWEPAPRLPLIDAWGGECHAGSAHELPESQQRSLCNTGYARGECPGFPSDAPADAARFTYTGAPARLIYILEKDHTPLEYGVIDPFSDPRPLLAAQARAFVESYAKLSPRTS